MRMVGKSAAERTDSGQANAINAASRLPHRLRHHGLSEQRDTLLRCAILHCTCFSDAARHRYRVRTSSIYRLGRIGNWAGGLSASRRQCSPLRRIRSARDNVLAPARMGRIGPIDETFVLRWTGNFMLRGTTGRVQDGPASRYSRMLRIHAEQKTSHD